MLQWPERALLHGRIRSSCFDTCGRSATGIDLASRQKVGLSGEGALQSHEPGSSDAEAVASPHASPFNARYAKKVKLHRVGSNRRNRST